MDIDISKIKFGKHGLVPAIVQEESGQVLMLAYMNEESLKKTIETGYTHFYSGNVQAVKDLYYDCDEFLINFAHAPMQLPEIFGRPIRHVI